MIQNRYLEYLSKTLSECTGAVQLLMWRRRAWAGAPLRFAPCLRSHGAPIAFRNLFLRNAIIALAATLLLSPAQSKLNAAEVVIYGGNASAVMAAVASARNGADTVLVNPGTHLGGMVSGGLGVTDAGRAASIGGIAYEFFLNLGAAYQTRNPAFRHEPHVAEQVFQKMLASEKIKVLSGTPLAEKDGIVRKPGANRIAAIRLENGQTIPGDVFIDASYEGDLMARAGVRYLVGRESRETYGESLAGVRNLIVHGDRDFASDESGLLPDIHIGEAGQPGEGDSKIMSYNFRLCMTRVKENQALVEKPERYDARRYALMAHVAFRQPHATLGSIFSIGEIPGGKADFNNIGPLSSNLLNASWAYPDASYTERAKIWADHRDYLQGLLWFLQNDPSVPPSIQKEAREWAPARDEFQDNGHWPHQLYIREARRMIGEKIMTQHDLQKEISQPDSVGMGSYMLDSHYVQRTLSGDVVISEGTLGGDHRVMPYQISYRSLVPKRAECENLLVPVCMSASHVAFASMRMEPVYMILGHSAGTAAALAAKNRGAVQDLDYNTLRQRLIEEKQVLEYKIEGQLDPASLEGIVMDEGEATLKGNWLKSTSGEPFVGRGYIHDNNTDKGKRAAVYNLRLPAPGTYEVRLYSARGQNRATNAKVTVTGVDGPVTMRINQRESLPTHYRSLGVFRFAGIAKVEISNEDSDGVVVADAVQLLPKEGGTSAEGAAASEEDPLFKMPPFGEVTKISVDALKGIVVDDDEAEIRGAWIRSANVTPFVGSGYRSDMGEKGECYIRYTPTIPRNGNYDVWIYYTAQPNRSRSVPVTIRSAAGEEQRTIDMTENPPNGCLALLLGRFPFEAGNDGYVEISNENSGNGVVVADAVQWIAQDEAADAGQAPGTSGSSSASSLAKAVESLGTQILASQLPDGALRMSSANASVRVVPYFSNIAAIALLCTKEERHLKPVRAWIDWYVAQQEPDGTIYDFIGVVGRYGKANHRDSTDSYAATFLQLLWRYAEAVGIDALTPEIRKAAEKAFNAIILTVDPKDGLTWAKPEYKVKYLMDNLEVCLGLEEGARLFRMLGRRELAENALAMKERIARSLGEYWQPQLGYFSWAKGSGGDFHIGLKKWYPDGVIHLYAVTALQNQPPGLWQKLQDAFGQEKKLTPDWWLRAAKVTGNEDERRRYTEEALRFTEELKRDGQLNRLGTTLLALVEEMDRRPSVEVPLRAR